MLLASCGGGGDDSGSTQPQAWTPTVDQATFTASQAGRGQAEIIWNMPGAGGALTAPANYVQANFATSSAADVGSLTRSNVTLAADLPASPGGQSRSLKAGSIFMGRSDWNQRVDMDADSVKLEILADDGTTVLRTERLFDFRTTPLAGAMAASPLELLGAVPLQNWTRGGNLAADGAWSTGASYTTRRRRQIDDFVSVGDCDATAAGTASPCPGTASTLDTFFPFTLQGSSGPTERDLATEGDIATIEGVRMWVARSALAQLGTDTRQYRVFFELGGQIHVGTLVKDGTPIYTREAIGDRVDHTTTLNGAAVDSIAVALIVQGAGGDGAASAALAGPTDDLGGLGATGVNGALSPADLRLHYDVPDAATGAGQTVVIIDGQSAGNVLADLNAYSRFFGLPECNDANPCFSRVDLAPRPAASDELQWAGETALDVEMVHAIAPAATIVLVTPASATWASWMAAVKYGAELPGVVAVSLSFGGPERARDLGDNAVFAAYPALAFISAGGDRPQTVDYPAASPFVTAVGGTRINGLRWLSPADETAWSFTGGGTSMQQDMPAWQATALNAQGGVVAPQARRITNDVAAIGDPRSGVSVFRQQAWAVVGGTSAGVPIWAGIAALAAEHVGQQGRSLNALMAAAAPDGGGFSALLYAAAMNHHAAFRDVVSGSTDLTGDACDSCQARPGFDALTGLGTPDVRALLDAL